MRLSTRSLSAHGIRLTSISIRPLLALPRAEALPGNWEAVLQAFGEQDDIAFAYPAQRVNVHQRG